LTLITHNDLIRSDPAVVRAFVWGLLEGTLAVLRDPTSGVAALKKNIPTTDEALALKSWEIEPSVIVLDETRARGLGYFSETRVAETITIASLASKTDVSVKPSDVYTTEFLPNPPILPPR